jgi:hypothetical protein
VDPDDIFRNPEDLEQMKEVRKDEIVELFPEPLRSEVEKWDNLSNQETTKNVLCRDAFIISMDVFKDIVFDGRFNDLAEALKAPMNKH